MRYCSKPYEFCYSSCKEKFIASDCRLVNLRCVKCGKKLGEMDKVVKEAGGSLYIVCQRCKNLNVF